MLLAGRVLRRHVLGHGLLLALLGVASLWIQIVCALALRIELFTPCCGGFAMSRSFFLQPGGFCGLGLGFSLSGARLRLGLVGESLAFFDVLRVVTDLLTDALRLHVTAPVADIARQKRQDGDDDDRDDDR